MPSFAPDPGVFVLHFAGDDEVAAERFRYDLAAALEAPVPLIVDLSEASALDPGLLALLVESVAVCEGQGRTLLLLVPEAQSDGVRRSFERNGLIGLLPVVRTWDEALRRARPELARNGLQAAEPGWTSPLS